MPMSRETLNHIYDVLHFVVQVREVQLVDFDWWRAKFKWEIQKNSAARLWERFKGLLKEAGIPFDLVDAYALGESNCQKLAIQFKLPAAWARIQELLDDESGEHCQDSQADQGDNAFEGHGRQRHGVLSVRKVDPRKRTG